ncbi:breast cancer metastasis-suppressor 1-like protein-A [Manduca sexta]|uniref:breast cancer metastasis-suppressor 1-like protein-A n=1 Tax=Manduca sexta TaxID=7130 RepID=UPI00188FA629|nr:breast cancer metastasis-suppressor 1-like protein-A [Manduca sexta]
MPSMKVEGDSDGDGDMSGGDTERSGGSSALTARLTRDSDDSSEFVQNNGSNLERQFNALREQLYHERVKQVEHQLAEVRSGRSQEYLGPLRRLQDNMKIRIEVAGILKQMRIENIKHKYEAEEQAAHQHFKVSYYLSTLKSA